MDRDKINPPLNEPKGGRVSVVNQISYQTVGKQPIGIPVRYCYNTESDEQPYTRNCKINSNVDWQKIDLGWIGERVSRLIIVNDEGSFTQVNPTDEEREDSEKKILQVAISDTHIKGYETNLFVIANIRPKRHIDIEPYDISLLRIRSLIGLIKYTLNLIPQ